MLDPIGLLTRKALLVESTWPEDVSVLCSRVETPLRLDQVVLGPKPSSWC